MRFICFIYIVLIGNASECQVNQKADARAIRSTYFGDEGATRAHNLCLKVLKPCASHVDVVNLIVVSTGIEIHARFAERGAAQVRGRAKRRGSGAKELQ